MSTTDRLHDAGSDTASSKRKRKNKKKANGSAKHANAEPSSNGTNDDQVIDEPDEQPEEDDEASTQEEAAGLGSGTANVSATMPSSQTNQGSHADGDEEPSNGVSDTQRPTEEGNTLDVSRNQDGEHLGASDKDRDAATNLDDTNSSETTARLDALQQERDSLRAEVTSLRQSLENLQERHIDDLSSAREDLEQSQQAKDHAETQYRNLLGKVNTIRSQLGERLKADAAELELKREQIEELENSKAAVHEENQRLQDAVADVNSRLESQAAEVETLRSRTTLSTSNWAKERDDLVAKEAYLREEYEVAKQAMQDWEILATEERARREALEERAQGLEDLIISQREAHERVRAEADTQSNTVDGLQRALRDLQEERKRELRELVEQSQKDLDSLRAQLETSENSTRELRTQLETTRTELDRAAPFEKEVKEKNLLIGKLRHEAVILNDHLTKALRFLKRGKPEDNVDRQLVTNHLLGFLQLDRSDPKKFQVLQLIAALLGWDEQQKEQAGLLRQGTGLTIAGGSLRVPVSPFRRTPSTPALTSDFLPESPSGATSRESLAELWSDFLEREAESGSVSGSVSVSGRRTSIARPPTGTRAPSLAGLMSPSSSEPRLASRPRETGLGIATEAPEPGPVTQSPS